MFLFKLFGSCGRFLWSEFEVLSGGYGIVNKEDFIMLNEFLLEEEFLFLEDIVVV